MIEEMRIEVVLSDTGRELANVSASLPNGLHLCEIKVRRSKASGAAYVSFPHQRAGETFRPAFRFPPTDEKIFIEAVLQKYYILKAQANGSLAA